MFTAAECQPFLFLKMDFQRGEIRPCMGPVAERLRFGSAASTPIDRARSNLQHIRTALRDDGLISHASSLLFLVPVVASAQSTDSGVAVPVLR
jgi:hypothetical protein